MADEKFPVSVTKELLTQDFTENGGKGEFKEIRYKGMNKNGLIVNISIKGAKQIVENTFQRFPQGSGATLEMIITSAISTETQQLIDSMTQEKEDKDSIKKKEIKPISLTDIQKEIEENSK